MGNERIRSKKKTANLFKRIIKKTLARPEQLTVSQWAEKYRKLDESSNLAGKWSNDVTPYLVEIMDSFNDPYIDHINVCKPSQVGGTEALINMLGWIVTQNPSPSMMVYPDNELAKDISTDKLQPAFLKSKSIADRLLINESADLNLKFKGMNLYLRTSNSPAKLASKAIRYLFFDEIDKLGGASKKEASPYSLALERTKTFKHTRKVYTCSTPTIKTNYVWKLHEAADDKRHYFVKCPHCGEEIEFKWSQIIFDDNAEKQLSNEERAQTAKYICQECGCVIKDREKPAMLRGGKWRSVERKCVGKPKSVSFWLNSLYSIFVTWADVAKAFLDAKDDPEQLQNFYNSWLAEPWEETRQKTTADLVLERQTELEAYVVPSWAKLITAGVDVQESSLYWTIRAWGNFITSQNIAHGQAYSWREIEKIMNLEYKKEDESPMLVDLCLVDSGDQTDDVYDFCADNADWTLPVKGSSKTMLSHYKLSKVNKQDSKANGMTLVMVDGGKYKDMIYSRMQRDNQKQGSWMVYKECDREYANQVTAEQKVIERNKNGTETARWKVKKSHADNHYLDAEVYAFAAADILNVRTLHLLQEDEEEEQQHEEVQTHNNEENWLNKNENWL